MREVESLLAYFDVATHASGLDQCGGTTTTNGIFLLALLCLIYPMPYKTHPSFCSPAPSSRLWRYMDCAKLASILTSQSLFFPTAITLAKTDKYEGWFRLPKTPPPLNSELVAMITKLTPLSADDAVKQMNRAYNEQWQFEKFFPLNVLINSWHMNDAESDAMWKVYARDTSYGVAIKTTFEKLTACFARTNPNQDIFIGTVTYIDYDKNVDVIDLDNSFNRFLYKRKAFEHEHEVRAVCCQPIEVFTPRGDEGTVPDQEMKRAKEVNERVARDGGLAVPIDVSALVGEIVLSPASPAWLTDVVRRMVSALGFDLKVICSDLEASPNDDRPQIVAPISPSVDTEI